MVNVTLSYATFTVESSALPENSIEHLLRLGFSTAIKNSIAGVKAGVLGNGANPWSDDDIKAEAERIGLTTFGRDEATALAICNAMQAEKFDDIRNGVVYATRQRGAKMTDDDKLRRTITIELLQKWAKEKSEKDGKPYELPKRTKPEEREAFDDLFAKAAQKWADKIEKEFKARKAKKFDLDDLID